MQSIHHRGAHGFTYGSKTGSIFRHIGRLGSIPRPSFDLPASLNDDITDICRLELAALCQEADMQGMTTVSTQMALPPQRQR